MDSRDQKLRDLCQRLIEEQGLRTRNTHIHGEWTGDFGGFFHSVRDEVAKLNPEFLGQLVVTDPIYGRQEHTHSISCLRPKVFGMFPFPEVNLGPRAFRGHLVDMVTCVVIVAISNYLADEKVPPKRDRSTTGI